VFNISHKQYNNTFLKTIKISMYDFIDGLGSTVRCKRNYSNYTLPYKSAPVSKQKPAVLTATSSQKQKPKKERHLHENVYIYREGMVPPSRQMFYQVFVNSFLCSIDSENT